MIIYRNVLDICIMRLYTVTFLNLCIRYHNCFIDALGLAIQKTMSSANKELSVFSPTVYPLSPFIALLHWLGHLVQA